MMTEFTVSLFGHRRIDDLRALDAQLIPIIRELLRTKPFVDFLIGRNGEFDEYAASLIKHVQKEHENESSSLTLALPYKVAGIEFYEKYYDGIYIDENASRAHPKAAIKKKNRRMIERSDLVIVYAKEKGGAYAAMRYAEKLKKPILRLT